MVTDALQHIPSCMRYLRYVESNENILRFCAIPQVMAIATLVEIYNNGKVFEGVVKIPKGIAARVITESDSIENIENFFL